VRIASVSDLHTDYEENRDAVVGIVAEIHRQGADLVIIAGDISHKNDRIERALTAFAEAAPQVAYLPGNHDLWFDVPRASERPDLDTWQRYEVELRHLVEATGAHYLPAHPLVLAGIAVIGTCGWYDYSLVLPKLRGVLDDATLATKQCGQLGWSDARYIAFREASGELMDDPAVAARMESQLAAQLAAVEGDPAVAHVVAVTHHLPFTEVVSRTGELPWEFFNAYMGSAGLGKVIASGTKVRAAIHGHTHITGEAIVDGLRVYGTALGYPRERHGLDDAGVLASRIGWIDL